MRKHKIAIQGIEASFHYLAAQQLFGEDILMDYCNSFELVCKKVISNEVDYGVMAIENLLTGCILTNYHLIQRYGLNVIGETTLPIELHLAGTKNASIEEIDKVISHPIALGQCSKMLAKHKWSIGHSADTAGSAATVANKNDSHLAAIVNEQTVQLYDLHILERNVQDINGNKTRFLVLSREKVRNERANQACISFELKHDVGTLSSVLDIIQQSGINLTKIQSIPIPDRLDSYSFIADLSCENRTLEKCLLKLQKETTNLNVLGTYIKNQPIS